MTLNLKKHKDDLLFLPLGGSGEIGMNMNLYYMDGKWLMVDFGAGFADDYYPGVDMLVPDISFILPYKKDIVGLVLTHAHEDHLGAIVYLWENFNCPIYATPFTASFLKAKIEENPGAKHAKIIEIPQGSTFKVGPFDIEMVQITHSAPEMNGVMLRTKHGNIFHTGDWKLDPKPMIGEPSDEAKIKKYGDEGILAMIGDSTNVFSPGHSGSEGDLRESLIKLVGECKKLAVVTTFASNIARIESIVVAARANNRKVVMAGRSLWRIVGAAQDAGYLLDFDDFVSEDQFSKYPREELLVIATGCQGEPMAAINKIATGSHRNITVRAGDSIIFSSKIIPGNEKRIFRLFNKFVRLGIETLTERDHFTHVSGHPNIEELKRMYELVRPQISVPVHGEHVHMHEHTRLARSWGVKTAFEMDNGVVLKLAPGAPEKVCQVQAGPLGVDGTAFLHADSEIMRMRRKMQREGIIVISLILDDKGLVVPAIILAPGVLDTKSDDEIFLQMSEEVEDVIKECYLLGKKQRHTDRIDNLVRSAVRKIIKKVTGKNPSIEVSIRFV